ncbi:Galactokinase [Indibacter alkaliphilus LW1]|uniref:Galactokinase n=1 Tax=Indibacter alkaliphilus (strain CCUG 57479 / KCTC 22604 / LW1) TaxID=1189612 RepID=S2DIS3_INDAL|nr:galactokinase [Indibacter alkaliphilus]EOZ97085.1 Galactokinase [Indibacter alkaliphilus LW1]
MKELLINTFRKLFDKEPVLVYSPGRINLIGEHTDYNEGFVMPAAINKKMVVAIAKNSGTQARIFSLDFEEEFAFDTRSFGPKTGHWSTYIMGVTAQLIQAGFPVKGFDMVFGGDIPVGAGLSSSAALEAATGFAIAKAFGFEVSKLSLVHYAQKAEHVFAGVQCGIMDQFASVMGKKDHTIRLDCRTLEYAHFPFKLENHCILLVDSKVKHSLADSAYNQRRNECREGVVRAQHLPKKVDALRDMDLSDLEQISTQISPTVYNRCKYVIEENARVLKASALLEKNDLKGFGEAMYASHQGLSELYEVSCAELDWLVDQTKTMDFVLGSRMMGGGFGGCTINIVQEDQVALFKKEIQKGFNQNFGKSPDFHLVSLEEGTGVM